MPMLGVQVVEYGSEAGDCAIPAVLLGYLEEMVVYLKKINQRYISPQVMRYLVEGSKDQIFVVPA
jgi:hypothetical protein